MTKQILFAGILCLVLAGTAQVFAHEMPAHKAATAAQASPVATLPHAAQEHDVHAESVADDDDEVAERPAKSTAKPRTTKTARKSAPKAPAKPAVAAPPIAMELDYESLTLAQLRARMTSLSVTDLRTLLAYEEAAKARAPFQTLLANRITRATAK